MLAAREQGNERAAQVWRGWLARTTRAVRSPCGGGGRTRLRVRGRGVRGPTERE